MHNRRHLLSISDLTIDDIQHITKLANQYIVDKFTISDILKNQIIINLFFEDSTRTLTSFEIAAQSLGAIVINIPIRFSSLNKGEDLKDMIASLDAMHPLYMIIRHQDSGMLRILSQYVTSCSVINAGDGRSEHPTQALIDYCVITKYKKQLEKLKVVICGDILHSRVARSNINLLKMFGVDIRLIAPPTLMYRYSYTEYSTYYSLIEGIQDVDVIMLLRLQKERIHSSYYLPSEKEYFYLYGLDSYKLSYAKSDVLIMHPGPVNRGIEISHEIHDSIILQQVQFGIAVRKAILHYYYIISL
ncbi:aspartate carbamoyltransferase catalytic subunit [Wolbachia endosymbiont of Howardula sp.]|uniref:aspartate carbamoyltransferase catalytic subunit n=1 Tax=Wolbachia endosymbiont of Howardula sp. TaxID=2916816 RepID=UPI00217D005D|nr:aspartate carbamoyltransferase catalytic subunit [Wolbachia endosymbiont of Howardula sp.]UWI83094.1 aspartate carbamoyltransferase catalytic subunit [Wolbachia endosymbiont of Howardula sp.]